MQLTDSELMARVAEGDREAFATLVERHKTAVTKYMGRLTGNHDRAEELAQETFVRLFQAAPGYRDQGRLLPYLFRIGTNLLRSEERRRRRWLTLAPVFGGGNGNGHAPGHVARAAE